jgi:geranylgeranyl reductase family protein
MFPDASTSVARPNSLPTASPTALPTAHPTTCDVLVVGAGPAGSACAQWLANAGQQVLLVDQHDFPRDKVCGDGLIPDTHAALKRLGVLEEVMSQATPVTDVRFVGPRGGRIDVPGTLSVLPRKVLDHILVRAAQRAGATLLTPLRFEAALESNGRVTGGRFKLADGSLHEIAARWVVLATGAVPQASIAAGLCERRTPSGVALRGYVKNEGLARAYPDLKRQLQMVWHPRLRGGYGWVFPAGEGLYNIGAGTTGSHIGPKRSRDKEPNLRQMFDAFCEVFPPAAELMAGGELQGEIKGAPLRCSLIGARWSRPGLLGTGEAVGSTYAFSGEGIGKAMETGILAAEALLRDRQATDADIQQRYELALQALKPKFDLYETASRVNHYPWLADLVIWRAQRSERIRRRLSGVLEETQNPGRLFTLRGMTKLMFE